MIKIFTAFYCIVLSLILLSDGNCQTIKSTKFKVKYNIPDADFLEKYSYLLIAYPAGQDKTKATMKQEMATGFFVRRNDKLFLIVARHTITKKSFDPPNKYFVYIKKSEGFDLWPIDISETKDLPDFHRGKETDAYILKLNEPKEYTINSIENFINWESSNYQKGDIGVLFSYPFPNYDPNYKASKCILKVKYEKDRNISTQNFVDSINYILEITSGQAGQGSSGGPIFIEKDGGFQFGGICISGFPDNGMLAVRPELIIGLLEKKMK